MENSSLFTDIQNFHRKNLRPSITKVTTENGKVYTEQENSGIYNLEISGYTHGYVLDTKPDLQVAYILPHLILASQDVAQDRNLLSTHKITHILNLAYGQPNHFESHFIYKKLDIRDNPDENIKYQFDNCFRFIDSGYQNGRILVHCNAGISRSATIVIAYLMNRQKMSFEEAFQFVKKVRSNIKPNSGFLRQLKEYEVECLQAEAK